MNFSVAQPLLPILIITACLASAAQSRGEIKCTIEHHPNDEVTPGMRFKTIPNPRKADAAAKATFTIVDGERDANGGTLDVLHDGRLPQEEDQPGRNFFFQAGTAGGRLQVDLGKSVELKQVNSYSWHDGSRGPQVYTIYASDGSAKAFEAAPKSGRDPVECGWKLLAKVDTRSEKTQPGGQYGASIQDTAGALGNYRYLLFDIRPTKEGDPFGNTFYSEIDVIDSSTAAEEPAAVADAPLEKREEVIETAGYKVTLETTEAPDLTDWVRTNVTPMAREWYPKLVELFPSDDFSAPRSFRVIFSQNMRGVAATGGTTIRCAGAWFRSNLQGEALGAVFHEMVHVIQQYGRSKPLADGARRPPGWLVEGIADYTRWYKFEPQSHGAEIAARNIARARYDASYRVTANFLNWASEKYDKDLVPQLNRSIREGRYGDGTWKDRTGHTVEELGAEWKAGLEKKMAMP